MKAVAYYCLLITFDRLKPYSSFSSCTRCCSSYVVNRFSIYSDVFIIFLRIPFKYIGNNREDRTEFCPTPFPMLISRERLLAISTCVVWFHYKFSMTLISMSMIPVFWRIYSSFSCFTLSKTLMKYIKDKNSSFFTSLQRWLNTC